MSRQKIIFLDIDGVLLPTRAYLLEPNRWFLTGRTATSRQVVPQVFDPVAVAMVQDLVEQTGASCVWSSSWASAMSREKLERIMLANGIDVAWFHESWRVPPKLAASRNMRISLWLEEFGTANWIALDDDSSLQQDWDGPLVKIDPGRLRRPRFGEHDGLTLAVFSQAAAILGHPASNVQWAAARSQKGELFLFLARTEHARLLPKTVNHIWPQGFVVSGELWFRLHERVEDKERLKDAADFVGRELEFIDAHPQELAAIFQRHRRQKQIGRY